MNFDNLRDIYLWIMRYIKNPFRRTVLKIATSKPTVWSLFLNVFFYQICYKKTSSLNHADHSYKLTCQRIPCATLFFPGSPIQPKYIIYNMIRCVFPATMLLFMPLFCRCHSDMWRIPAAMLLFMPPYCRCHSDVNDDIRCVLLSLWRHNFLSWLPYTTEI
jgi:hypothetical protein